MAADRPIDSSDLIAMLRRHYIPDEKKPAGIFAPEIQAPGRTLRRADLIWHGATAAAGGELIGHEVKVTRSDLISELADLTKSDPWQRYCNRWFLVLPDFALADGLELPPTWGVLTPPSGRRTRSMTVHIKAPKLQPHDQTPALRTLLAWMHWRHHNLSVERQREARRVQELAATCEELQLLVPGRMTDRQQREQEVVRRIVRELGGVNHDGEIGTWNDTIEIADVVAVLKDITAAQGLVSYAESRLAAVRGQLRSLGGQIDSTLKQTAKIPAQRSAGD